MMNSSFILTITNIPHNSAKQQIDLINPHDVRLKIPFLKRFGKFKLQILASNELV